LNISGEKKMSQDAIMKVLQPKLLAANPGPLDFFTGTVQVTPVMQGEDPSSMTCGCVTFDPYARSAWHTHPKGQLLIVTAGAGFVQEWNKPVQKIKQGDVVWTPPGVKHWHGAQPTSSLTHLAIQELVNGKNVEWLEKVTDEQYNNHA
jgi:quercetin dioxygenase-like cupin family protein